MFSPVVTIAALGETQDGVLLRALIERMGLSVQYLPLTSPQDLIDLVGAGADVAKTLVIAGRGTTAGFIFDGDVDPARQDDGVGPDCLRGRFALNGQLVISTAQVSGRIEMAQTFVDGGAGAYLAPEGWPPPAVAALFLHVFLHEHLLVGHGIADAMERAHSYADAFTLYLGDVR